MDPNENLKEQLELARRRIDVGYNEGELDDNMADADRLAELVMALHVWIENGGFLPDKWLNDWVKPMRKAMAEAHGLKEEDMPGFEAIVYSTCSLVHKGRTAINVVKRIVEVLYPGGDLHKDWSADELQEINQVLIDEDLIPRCDHEVNHEVGIALLEGDTYYCECVKCETQGEFKFEGHTAEIMWKETR